MPDVTDVSVGYSEIKFQHEEDGVPAHYQVVSLITAETDDGGVQARTVFHWNSVVLTGDAGAPYREVDAQAARQLAPTLRAVADRIEKIVSDSAARLKRD